MSGRDVAVTGVGMVTPLGLDRERTWARIHEPHSAVKPITRFDPAPFRSRIAAVIEGFDPEALLGRRTARRTDRCSQLALVAAAEALEHSGIDLEAIAPARAGVMMGTALGGIGFAEEQNGKFLHGGLRAVDPLLALTVFGGALSCNLAIAHGITGINSTNSMSCASGTLAIGEAFRAIAGGEADVMLAGGSEAPIQPLCFGSFALIRAMSTRNDDPAAASRPFDRDRDGFVMAEGAAVLVLEEAEHALRRGAKILARVTGHGLSNDAHHMTQPRPDGREVVRAMQLALDDAGVLASSVDWVQAHGSATPLNDGGEATAIRTVFGSHADDLQVSGTKGWHGHALGASGAIETALVVLAMARGWVPGTLNCPNPIEEGALSFIGPEGMEFRPRRVLKESFGFGGCNATLLLQSD